MSSINILVSLAFPIILMVCVWCGFIFLFVKMSKFDKLAAAYGYESTFLGKIYPMCSGYIGTVRYKGALTIGISEEGLYLKPFFLFRLGNPPILIPWQEISRIEEKNDFWLKSYVMDVYCPEKVTLKLPLRVFQAHADILERLMNKKSDSHNWQ